MLMEYQVQCKIKVWFMSLCFLLCISTVAGAAVLIGDIEPKIEGEKLIQALKRGNYVIYFRHGITNKVGEKNVEKKDLDNCLIQRNLSPEGRAQTKEIGMAVKRHRIPIGDVYTSPYCRCVDTAINLFGKGEKSDALHFALHTSKAEREEITEQLLEMLATPPQAGTNTALISHTANLNSAVKIFPQPETVAHVFKPEGEGKFSYVGMVMPEMWLTNTTDDLTVEEKNEGWLNSIRTWFSSLF